MRTLVTPLTAVAAALLWIAPNRGLAQGEGITISDFSTTGTAGISSGLTETGKLRRGVTSTVLIIKNLIDLVPDGQINVSGGGSLVGSVTHGRTSSSGIGFISMKVSVPSSQSIGSTITINVGLLDHFKFNVVHRGEISTVSFNPNPTTILAGTPFTVNVSGTDFGSPVITNVQCHSVTMGTVTGTTLSATLTRSASCSLAASTPFGFFVTSTASGERSPYSKSDGTKSFPFGPYQAPPPEGVACVSAPNIGAPIITAPVNNSTINFLPASDSTQSVRISWLLKTGGDVLAPNNEWIVTVPTSGLKTSTTVTGISVSQISVTGTSVSHGFRVPGTYTVSVRAKNCGITAPSSSVTFTLKFQ